jgi:hypothetical protein
LYPAAVEISVPKLVHLFLSPLLLKVKGYLLMRQCWGFLSMVMVDLYCSFWKKNRCWCYEAI